jgi:hypothetical protein
MVPEAVAPFTLFEDTECLGALAGWARHLKLPKVDLGEPSTVRAHNIALAHAVCNEAQWPLVDDNFTGSFSAVAHSRKDGSTVIFNDSMGTHPVYYTSQRGALLGSTSLLVLGRTTRGGPDAIGILQAISGGDFCNYGRRTILRGVDRLLPGELIHLDRALQTSFRYDNLLYQDGGNDGTWSLAEAADRLWDCLREDIAACAGNTEVVNLALSGGWDSRIVLAGLRPIARRIRCFTYGTGPDEYEVALARKLAQHAGAQFIFCDMAADYFPTIDVLTRNVAATENAAWPQWFPILQSPEASTGGIIMLGDAFDSVTGRNVLAFSTPQNRQRLFATQVLGRRPQMTPASAEAFATWSEATLQAEVGRQLDMLFALNLEVIGSLDRRDIEEGLRDGVGSFLHRVGEQCHIHAETYDELYRMYVYGRNNVGRHLLTLSQRFTALGPTMSFRALRLALRVDPVLRANGMLLDRLIRRASFGGLSNVPTADTPFMPQTAPLLLKLSVWGARVMADRALIRRYMRARDHRLRRRVIRSIDYAALYSRPEVVERVRSWFSGRYIEPSVFVTRVEKRARLETPPFVPTDIIGPANASILLDLVYDEAWA